MSSPFLSLDIAVSGLYSAQRNLDIVSHNLSNISTPGYSRQYGVQVAASPMRTYNGSGMIGTGSQVIATRRMRNEYLDTKYWSEVVSLGEWSVKASLMDELQAVFNEPSKGGFAKYMDQFFSALQELSKDPTSGAARALVRENGVTLASYFNNLAVRLEKLQKDINDSIQLKVSEINTLAEQISSLNDQIARVEFNGSNANDLRDQRTVLIDKLARLVQIDVYEETIASASSDVENKRLVITISGKALVSGQNCSRLKVVPRQTAANPGVDIDGLYDVMWEDGNKVDILGGELKGYLDVRDGNNIQSGYFVGNSFNGAPTAVDATIKDNLLLDGHVIPIDWTAAGIDFSEDWTVDPDPNDDIGIEERKEAFRAAVERALNKSIDDYNATGIIPQVQHVKVTIDQLFNRLTITSGTTGKRSEVSIDCQGAGNSVGSHYFGSGSGVKGNAINFKGIPYYIDTLNKFVRTFAKAFNEGYVDENRNGVYVDKAGHADGYILDSTSSTPDGIRFFTVKTSTGIPMSSEAFIGGASDMKDICLIYENMTAKNFTVSKDVLEDTSKIAASDTSNKNGNTNNLLSLIDLRYNTKMFSEGSCEDFMKSLIGTMGTDAQMATGFYDNQDLIVSQVDNIRISVSGVSQNEEMINLVRYQHSYNAAARMIVVMGEIYDVLFNTIGVA